MQKHNIKTIIDPVEIMQTKQPNTISIDGVEIPSNQYFWEKHGKMESKIESLKKISIIQGASIILIALSQLLR